jgi:DNA-binding CsgD family transcriptional regulator
VAFRKVELKDHKIIINQMELFYLRLAMHGFDVNEIQNFLEINRIDITNLKNDLMDKFDSTNLLEIMSKAINYGFININDFVETPIKNLSINYAESIYYEVIETKMNNTKKDLKKLLLNFLKECDREMKNYTNHLITTGEDDENEKVKIKLNQEELDLLALKHRGFNNLKVKLKLEISDKKFDVLRRSIFYKLNANNWFNALRKLHRMNCLKQPKKKLNFKLEFDYCFHEIYRLKKIRRLFEKDKKLMIYSYLLSFYNKIEFNSVLGYFQIDDAINLSES